METGRAPLPSNKELTMGRLKSTTRKLEKMQRLEENHMVMKQQMEEGILEVAPEIPTGGGGGRMLHSSPAGDQREQVETTKMRIVYDCSAKTDPQILSLNDCLEVGPPFQPLIFDILLRNRLKFLCITGDIQKAFLQIKVNQEDRDALCLLWYENLDSRTVVHYRFTRVIFGSGPSPYILGATLQKHVSQYADKYPRTTDELLKNTYVDDVQSGGEQHKEILAFKEESTRITEEGRLPATQMAQQHPRVRTTPKEWRRCNGICNKFNLCKVRSWNWSPRNKDFGSSLEQD